MRLEASKSISFHFPAPQIGRFTHGESEGGVWAGTLSRGWAMRGGGMRGTLSRGWASQGETTQQHWLGIQLGRVPEQQRMFLGLRSPCTMPLVCTYSEMDLKLGREPRLGPGGDRAHLRYPGRAIHSHGTATQPGSIGLYPCSYDRPLSL